MTRDVHDFFGSAGADVSALVRRAVTSQVEDATAVDETVQETIARLLTASCLDHGAIGPYAIVTTRNLVATRWRAKSIGHLSSTGSAIPDGQWIRRAP